MSQFTLVFGSVVKHLILSLIVIDLFNGIFRSDSHCNGTLKSIVSHCQPVLCLGMYSNSYMNNTRCKAL